MVYAHSTLDPGYLGLNTHYSSGHTVGRSQQPIMLVQPRLSLKFRLIITAVGMSIDSSADGMYHICADARNGNIPYARRGGPETQGLQSLHIYFWGT